MAVTQNTYTGNGSTVLFSFTFPYLETTDIKVSVNGTNTTAYTLANATTIQFNTAPANGAAIRIYRQTNDSSLTAQFYPGSAIRSQDLNDNFTQNLYVTQESTNNAATATTNASTALSNSNTAIATANGAVTTANAATTTANNAVTTANNAVTTANNAVATANTASTNSTNAVNTANTALTTANNANTTAQTANTNSQNAVSLANSALNTIAGSTIVTAIADVASIPGSPANGDAIQVQDSTGIGSFTPLSGLPVGFVGSAQLNVRLTYDGPNATWDYQGYGVNDPDIRYVVQGKLGSAVLPAYYFDQDTGIYSPGSNEIGISTGGNARLTIDSSGNVAIPGGLTRGGHNVVTVGDTGTVTSTMIANGTIVDADVNASAAIAGTKVSPNFGSQNVTTTGTVTGASLIPSSSTVPTNGVYLPSAGSVAISTGGYGRLFVDASGNVEIAGTGKRIRGDFSNATHANRLCIQTSTTDGNTAPFIIPNGTGTGSQIVVSNSSDLANTSWLSLGCFGGAINEARLNTP